MARSSSLVDLSLTELGERIADRSPTPAAGVVTAAAGALGAALASMALRHSAGEGQSGVAAYQAGRAAELDALRAALLELVDGDARAFRGVLAAGRTFAGKVRDAALQEALRGAIEAPFEILESALSCLRILAAGCGDTDPRLASECDVAALLLWAASEGAHGLVATNARELTDGAERREREALAGNLRGQARTLRDAIRSSLAPSSERSEA